MLSDLAKGVYDKLAAATGLTTLIGGTAAPRIYHLQADELAVLPYVVYNVQGGGDENYTANRTKNIVLWVRGYSDVSAKAAADIDAQIDAALHMQQLTVAGYDNFWLARESDVEAVETPPSAQPIYAAGGMYRVRLDKS